MKKKKIIFSSLLFCAATLPVAAQNDFNYNEDSQFRPQTNRKVNTDSLGSDKEIPKGIRVWTVDERFGDTKAAVVDTLQHMYMNSTFTEGLRGEYNTLGNMGTARLNRIFIDRRNKQGNFIFTEPYDYIVKSGKRLPLHQHLLTYHQHNAEQLRRQGDGRRRLQGHVCSECQQKARRAGFRFDYKYGRGYH